MKSELAFWRSRARARTWRPSGARSISRPSVELAGQRIKTAILSSVSSVMPDDRRTLQLVAEVTAPSFTAEIPEFLLPEFAQPAAAETQSRKINHTSLVKIEAGQVTKARSALSPLSRLSRRVERLTLLIAALIAATFLFAFGSAIGGISVLAFMLLSLSIGLV